MADGLGRAMLRSTIASVAGIMAMDLYSSTMKKMKERRQGDDSADATGPERQADERRDASDRPADEARSGAAAGSRPWNVEEHRAASQGSDGDDVAARVGPDEGQEHPLDDISLVGQTYEEGEAATEAVGRIFYERLRDEEPSGEKKAQLGQIVHWGYGMAVGSLFALVDRKVEGHDLAVGLGYGTALWLLGDELAVPMLGLADGPTAHPPSVHAQALGAHLVYGLTTSAANRALRRFV